MQENTPIAEIPTNEPAPEFVSTTGGDSVHQDLEAFFASQEDAQIQQVDNLESESGNEDTTDNQPAEESETPEETADTTTDKSVDKKTDPVIESANFDALENPETPEAASTTTVDYPDEEALKAKYPRQSNALIAETAQYAAKAAKGEEVINKIGGEEFIEPVATIATALKEGNPQQFFQGVIEAADENVLLDVLGNAMQLGLVKSKDFIADPNTKAFGERLQGLADIIIQNRFGEDLSLEKLDTLTEFQKHGWLDAIQRWKEYGFADPDEFDELCQGEEEPAKFKSLKQQLAEKESQLAQFESKLKENESSKVAQVELDFDKENGEALEKVLNNVVLTTSNLRDFKGDTQLLKGAKQVFREILQGEALTALKTSTARQMLLDGYKAGNKSSKDYGKNLTVAINSAILQVKERTKLFEEIVKTLTEEKTLNGLRAKNLPNNEAEKLPPTQTTKPVNNGTKSIRDIEKELEAAFS